MKKTDLKNMLNGFENKEFINLIYDIVKNDGKAEQVLLDFCKKRSNTPKRNIKMENSIKRCWQYVNELIQLDITGDFGEDEEFELFHTLENIENLSANHYIPWNLKKSILDMSIEYIHKKDTYFDEVLIEFCENLCNTKEEKSYLYTNLTN